MMEDAVWLESFYKHPIFGEFTYEAAPIDNNKD
jgi:hypothetical protein